jgi:hypothetical protein
MLLRFRDDTLLRRSARASSLALGWNGSVAAVGVAFFLALLVLRLGDAAVA